MDEAIKSSGPLYRVIINAPVTATVAPKVLA